MQRYNIFYQIHKGLREMLYNSASLLQQTDFGQAVQRDATTRQLTEVLDLFDKHAATEDHWILPAIAQYEPAVTNLFAEEHIKDHELGEKLRSIIKGLQEAGSIKDHETWGAVLRPVFIEFMIFNLEHMAKEEDVLNRLLWRYFSDEELQGITQKILGYLPPETLQQYSAWMIRGLSNNEIIGWLKDVKATAPDFVYEGLKMIAEKELSQQRWNFIRQSIGERALAA